MIKTDQEAIKIVLAHCKMSRSIIQNIEKHELESGLNSNQVYMQHKEIVELSERFVELIDDEYTQKIMDYRFIKGYTWSDTANHFCSLFESSTIGRRINKGIAKIVELADQFEKLDRFHELSQIPKRLRISKEKRSSQSVKKRSVTNGGNAINRFTGERRSNS